MSPAAPAPQHGRVPELGGATDVHSSVVMAAAVSVPLSLLVALCLLIRRCRKRGRGTMAASARSGRQGDKNWSVGDILGRSKDGFKPLNTDEGDGMLDEDSESEVGIITYTPCSLQICSYDFDHNETTEISYPEIAI